jgi:hypothetical protein
LTSSQTIIKRPGELPRLDMHTITFFRQARADGGIRMGIDINGALGWHHFQPGDEEYDPALVWYVDVECQGPNRDLPEGREKAKQWLLDRAPIIKAGLCALADKLRLGFDAEEPDYEQDIVGAPPRVTMMVICSAVRRIDARRIAKILKQIATDWEDLLGQLAPAQPSFSRG